MSASIFLTLYFTVFGLQKAQTADFGIAISLVSSLPGTPTNYLSEEEFHLIKNSVQEFCIKVEILDPRETSYIFAKHSDFIGDLELLRRRYREYNDAPMANESEKLPNREEVNRLVTFNRAFRKVIVEKYYLERDRGEAYEEIMMETDKLYKVWDAVRDARCEFYYVTVRRQALIRLKEMLGDEAYYTMNLPPNVPTWRFEER